MMAFVKLILDLGLGIAFSISVRVVHFSAYLSKRSLIPHLVCISKFPETIVGWAEKPALILQMILLQVSGHNYLEDAFRLRSMLEP
ncbi:hypothetical protein NSTC745_03913 [Nostoc sp. DSM 114161]|jgi:hypothetical protein